MDNSRQIFSSAASGEASIQFDGIDDCLISASPVEYGNGHSVTVAFSAECQRVANEVLIESGSNSELDAGSYGILNSDAGGHVFQVADSGRNFSSDTSDEAQLRFGLVTFKLKGSTETGICSKTPGSSKSCAKAEPAFDVPLSNLPLNLGGRSTGLNPFQGKLYGLVIAPREMTAPEENSMFKHVKKMTGV